MTQTPINNSKSFFEFEGFAPLKVKSHKGTFKKFEGTLLIEDNKIISLEGTAQVKSLKSDNEKLTQHLLAQDMFNSEKYPEIKFKSTSIKNNTLKGNLTFHGKTHEVSFLVTQTENSLSAEFSLNTRPFGFKPTGIQKDIKIKFRFSV